MTKAISYKRWETRPLECWTKAKELRAEFDRGRVKAAEEGKALVDGRDTQIFAALGGNLQSVMTNPLGAISQARNHEFARQCRGEAECQGFGREICGYHRNVFGSMYLNRDLAGGTFPRRDISIPTPASCDQHSLRGKPVADYYAIPRFQGEAPVYTGPRDPARDKVMIDHRVNELLDEIEWLEKQTGKSFDDEEFRKEVTSQLKLRQYAGEVCFYFSAVPSPLDEKTFDSFYTFGSMVRADLQKMEDLWRMLRDELKWRVENHIAAVATERFRWVEDEPPPWAFLKYYRYMEKYGAVCIGSPYTHYVAAPFEWRTDGTYRSKPTPLELSWPMNTREEIIRAMMSDAVGRDGREIAAADQPGKSRELLNMAKFYHCDGALLPLHRAGVGCDYGRRESGLVLAEAGYACCYYESPQPGDCTDLDVQRFLDQLDTWMESHGLRKLED
ncbi:MAG: 2-hydroxyacyl-CoA dehydratase [Chloroflexi bacterium]|nr:2-hydroxyacyl-CoA dehydratase [Chloroflexota bacterium]